MPSIISVPHMLRTQIHMCGLMRSTVAHQTTPQVVGSLIYTWELLSMLSTISVSHRLGTAIHMSDHMLLPSVHQTAPQIVGTLLCTWELLRSLQLMTEVGHMYDESMTRVRRKAQLEADGI